MTLYLRDRGKRARGLPPSTHLGEDRIHLLLTELRHETESHDFLLVRLWVEQQIRLLIVQRVEETTLHPQVGVATTSLLGQQRAI